MRRASSFDKQHEEIELHKKKLSPYDIVLYSVVTLLLGLFVGYAMGHYEQLRFQMVKNRISTVKTEFKALEAQRVKINGFFEDFILKKAQVLINREFAQNCAMSSWDYNTPAEFQASTKIERKLDLRKTEKVLTIPIGSRFDIGNRRVWNKGGFTLAGDKQSMKEVDPMGDGWNVCWIVVPGLDYE